MLQPEVLCAKTLFCIHCKGCALVSCADLEVSEAWSAHSDSPHVLSAAGLGPFQPCATAPHSDKAQQHRVIIWWPRQQQPEPAAPSSSAQQQQGEKQQPVAGSASTAGAAASSHSHQHASSTVGAEVIRHPVKVLSMQWSPALASIPAARLSLPPPPAVAQPGTPAPVPAVVPDPGLGPSLALMTVGADWSVRIWVEVQMRDLFPTATPTPGPASGAGVGPTPAASAAAAAAATAAMSMSQFCLTLVIEPPFHGLDPGVRPGLRACWANPLPRHGAAVSTSAPGSPVALQQPWGIEGALAGALGLAPDSADQEALALSCKVHWVVISVGIFNEKEGGRN